MSMIELEIQSGNSIEMFSIAIESRKIVKRRNFCKTKGNKIIEGEE